MVIEKELLDNLFANYNYQKPEDLIGENVEIFSCVQGFFLCTFSFFIAENSSKHQKSSSAIS